MNMMAWQRNCVSFAIEMASGKACSNGRVNSREATKNGLAFSSLMLLAFLSSAQAFCPKGCACDDTKWVMLVWKFVNWVHFEVECCLLQHQPGCAAHRAEHADQADQDEPQQDQGGRRLLPVLRAPPLHRPLQQHHRGYWGQELCSTGVFFPPNS